jgi:hypothetical protein
MMKQGPESQMLTGKDEVLGGDTDLRREATMDKA